MTGVSISRNRELTAIGWITAVTPRIARMLKMFEPIVRHSEDACYIHPSLDEQVCSEYQSNDTAQCENRREPRARQRNVLELLGCMLKRFGFGVLLL
jgi:hypothetical protein